MITHTATLLSSLFAHRGPKTAHATLSHLSLATLG
ncbi:hypothetical protein GMORB2_5370 [Geosmithia morbida]|uniref:Uncharacterized protein n=1 Tax=Geosmithia morbida TaxID=1094350 RepID=A0A9P4YZM5_9HYPO|nr:uncharacterized protein GMORB2_5370 [Geosmithia morbida]KAF4124704.1 hypothetical protein GMORB2_5370 [Geosmithia morbida]